MQRPTYKDALSASTGVMATTRLGAADVRIKKLHGPHMVRVSCDHNLRKKHCPYAHASMPLDHSSPRITILHGSTEPQDVAAAARRRQQDAGIKRLRKNQLVALEIMVTLRPGACDEEAGFFQRALERVADQGRAGL